MIDTTSEKPITLRLAGTVFPPGRSGRPRHISYFVRAITRGVNGHRLEAVRDGSRWLTSKEALQRWLERQTSNVLGEGVSAGVRPAAIETGTARRRHSVEATARELDALGL